MQLNKIINWVVPEGFHQAKVVDARLTRKSGSNKQDDEDLRLMLEITSLINPTKKLMAKRVYRRSDSEEIIADLEHLLGDNINSVINLQGEIIGEGLMQLVGRAVDIEIVHHQGKNHDQPFCLVTQVKNPGLLIEEIDYVEEIKIAA